MTSSAVRGARPNRTRAGAAKPRRASASAARQTRARRPSAPTSALAPASAPPTTMDLMPLPLPTAAPAGGAPEPFARQLAAALEPSPAQPLRRWLAPLAALGSLLRRGARQVSRRPRRDLRMCEMLPLSEKRFLAVVRYGDVHFLIGGAQNSLTLLSRLEPNSVVPQPVAASGGGGQHVWSC